MTHAAINTELNAVVGLMQSARHAIDTVEGHVKARGWKISRTHLLLAMVLGTGLRRPTDIANSLGVTRQAVHQTILEMISQGLIFMEPDPSDRRAKVILRTPSGNSLCSDIVAGVSRLTDGHPPQ